jgi:hypothetical protein
LKGAVMVAVLLYEGDVEQKQHAAAIHRIASDLDVPEEKIRTLYESELQSLKDRAKVKDYLVILVSRYVKDLLRRTNSSLRSQ